MTGEGQAAFDDLEPWGHGARVETQLFVHGVELAVPLAVMGVLLTGYVRRRRRAARAEAVEASAAAAQLVPGEAVVRGTVVEIDEGDAAVRVTVVQNGRESKSKNRWHTHWSEVERRIEARPFQIELQDGKRLRVEPGPSPRLVDDLDLWTREGTKRTASATLERGETVFAHGEIVSARTAEGGYRGGEALVLRPPRGRPMSLSTHGLAAPEREAARHLARAAGWAALVLMIAQLLALPYHASRWFGETRSATIEKRWSRAVKRKKGIEQQYFVRYRVKGSGAVIEDRVDDERYPRLTEGTVVPVRVSPLETTLGPHPTLHGLLVLPTSLFVLVALGLSLQSGFRARAWYERRLDEIRQGRLAE